MSQKTPVCNALLLCALLASLAACSQKTMQSAPHEPTAASAPAPAQASGGAKAVRAYIDPKTGQLRDPTPEEIAALSAAEAAANKAAGVGQAKPTEPREVRLPNGTVMIQLDESSQQPLKACVQKGGDVKMDHDCDAAGAGANR